MLFTFLGTSAGKPTKERNVSAVAFSLKNDSGWYLFDCGESTQHQLLRTPYSIPRLKYMFITHLHGDHCYGIPGVLSSRSLLNVVNPLSIFGPIGIKEYLCCIAKISKRDLLEGIEIIELSDQREFILDKFKVTNILLDHNITSFAYYIEEITSHNRLNKDKLLKEGIKPSKIYALLKEGKRVKIDNERFLEPSEYYLKQRPPRKIIVGGDNANPNIFKNSLSNIDLLIHEATYTSEVYSNLDFKAKHTTAKSLALACKSLDIKNLIATHISPRYSSNKIFNDNKLSVGLIQKELADFYDGVFFIANDFDRYMFSEDKRLTKV